MIKVKGWSSVFVILILLISLSECEILTKQENENRLRVCGTKNAAKVWQGRTAAQTEAPWSVYYKQIEGTSMNVCTGTVVSSRHILMATHCFGQHSATGFLNDKMFDKAKNCKDGHYFLQNDNYLMTIQFLSDGKKIAAYPERVILVNACQPMRPNMPSTNLAFEDFAIVELYEDLVFSPTVQMACVADDVSANRAGVELDYFGFGINPPDDTPGVLRHEKTQIIARKDITDIWFVAKDPHKKNIACVGDSGGGAFGPSSGRTTVIGVLSQTTCSNPATRTGDNAAEIYAPVGLYYPVICKFTGICLSSDYDIHHAGYARSPKPSRIIPAGTVSRAPPLGPPSPGQQGGGSNGQAGGGGGSGSSNDGAGGSGGGNGNVGAESGNGAHAKLYDVVTLVLSLVLSLIV